MWIRGNDSISFNRPHLFFVQGIRGSGKSTLLETLGVRYLQAGHCVLDLFSSRDGENLAWLRSPHAEESRVLLLHGEAVDVECSWPVKRADQVSLSDFETHDIVISSPPLYLNMDQEFTMIAHLMDKLYRRLHWRRLVYTIIREASNFLYSRVKVTEDQTQAKSQAIYLLREARHCGLPLGLDSVRLTSIDVDIRAIADYVILKAQGVWGLPRDLKWLYRYFRPRAVQAMPPKGFIIVSRRGAVGLGVFNALPWHKREREDILSSVGLRVEYGEPVETGRYRGRFTTVGDREHAEIVRLYVEEGLSMREVAEKLGRSTATVKAHLDRHNRAVGRSGFCPACRRAGSPLDGETARREAKAPAE